MVNNITQESAAVRARLHPDTAIGQVALTVSGLERSIDFYRDVLGFSVLSRSEDKAVLGAGQTPLLLLTELPGATPKPHRATGLYHFAILVPGQSELARSVKRLAESGYAIDGMADHLVSEAFYLSDPDRNGIEIYRDRPRSEWIVSEDGQVAMASDPIDMRALFASLDGYAPSAEGLDTGTRIGHVHLQIADVAAAERFYVDILGFDTMARWNGALFVSAGGYHHHLGLNTWSSRGGQPAPEGSAGLRYFSVILPNDDEVSAVADRLVQNDIEIQRTPDGILVADPFRNRILLTSKTTASEL